MNKLKKSVKLSANGNRSFTIFAAVFAAWTLISFWGGLSSVLNYAFAPTAFLLALYFFQRSKSSYFSFLLWLWLLTPEVRRLVDYKTTFHQFSIVQLAPFLATSLNLILIFKHLPRLLYMKWFPFALCTLGVIYGYLVGILNAGFTGATYDFLNWMLPIAFALAMALEFKENQEIFEQFFSTMCIGLLVVSAYGIVQFFFLPPWDAYWIIASNSASGGSEEMSLRVFGPLNSAGIYAVVLDAGLLYALAASSKIKLLAMGLALPALALCLVRSSWGAFAIGLMFMFLRSSSSFRTKLSIFAIAACLLALPLLSINTIADRFSSRLNTLTSLDSDHSFQSRSALYSSMLASAFEEPLGTGLGATGTSALLSKGKVVAFDSGLLLIPQTLGWVGGLFYFGGILWLVFGVIFRSRAKQPIAIAAAAAALGIFAELVFAQTLTGFIGTFFWLGAAIQICYSDSYKRHLMLSNRYLGSSNAMINVRGKLEA